MSLLVYANLIFVALKIKSSKTIYTKIVNQKALVVELVDTKDLKDFLIYKNTNKLNRKRQNTSSVVVV